jgi:hypothetical protein
MLATVTVACGGGAPLTKDAADTAGHERLHDQCDRALNRPGYFSSDFANAP